MITQQEWDQLYHKALMSAQHHDAEDIVQDALVHSLKHYRDDMGAKFTTLAHRNVKNMVSLFYRTGAKKRMNGEADPYIEDWGYETDPDLDLDLGKVQIVMDVFLESLSLDQRIIWRHTLNDERGSVTEAAQALGISRQRANLVKNQLRARFIELGRRTLCS